MVSLVKFLVILSVAITFVSCQQRINSFSKLLKIKLNGNGLNDKRIVSGKAGHELLVNYDNFYYYGKLFVGNPAQLLLSRFDTLNSKTWLLSKHNDGKCVDNHRTFDNQKSSTYNKGDGKIEKVDEMSGPLVSDTIELSHIKIDNQTFIEINNTPNLSVCSIYYDAIVGLGLSEDDSHKSILQNLVERKLISKQIFSIYYETNSLRHPGGEIIFGGYDEKYFTGDINYFDINSKSKWQIKLNGISSLDDQNKTVTVCKNGCNAAINSASLYINGPSNEIKTLNDAIGAKKPRETGNYEFDCEDSNGLPDVEFSIGDKKLKLTTNQYVRVVPGSTRCESIFQDYWGHEKEQNDWIIGIPFVGYYYTIFDYENKKIGFAPVRTS